MSIKWITPEGTLGTFDEKKLVNLRLEAWDEGGSPLTYYFFYGEIPEGITLFRSGVIQGKPLIGQITTTTNNLKYKFAVKVVNSKGEFNVREFAMTVNFEVVAPPTASINWITPAGLINRYAEGKYIEFKLDAYDKGGSSLTYKVISGDLTYGMQLQPDGWLQGVPTVEQTSTTLDEFAQTFTVRVTNIHGEISDRTFSLVVNNIALPQIIPKVTSLGSFYDGHFLDVQLDAIDPNPLAVLQWSKIDGELPLGTTLTSDGKLSGYIRPFYSPTAEAFLNWNQCGWDFIPWDCPTPGAQSKTYRFTVQVFDGSRYDHWTYTVFVQAKRLFTVDNTHIGVDNTEISVDTDNRHRPFIVTESQDIPEQRQDSNFAFQIIGEDLDGDDIRYNLLLLEQGAFDQGPTPEFPLTPIHGFDQGPAEGETYPPEVGFDQSDSSLPPGIELDHVTGWVTGHLGTQVEERLTYTFYVYCYKVDDPTFVSEPIQLTLTVLGALDNYVEWITPSELGYMDNGVISELLVTGVSSKGKTLNYRLKEPLDYKLSIDNFYKYTTQAYSKLPQGLTLLDNGLIVGRTTFEYFSLDGGKTTLDKGAITFDYEFKFTVTASDESLPNIPHDSIHYRAPSVSSDKEFTIKIKNYNKSPYENVYLRALPSPQQRNDFTTLLGNKDIFPPELIYRPADPWFGKATDIKFLFAAGMNPNYAKEYIASMSQHHYNKRISLGDVKTAVALDENYNVRYEVVYVDVVDSSDKAAYSIDRTMQVDDPYRGPPFTAVYPNSLDNMKTELTQLGYANRGAMPDWMLNQQEDGRVLGFTRGVVLAYTVPGAGKLIAYRLQHSEIPFNFNQIDFEVDRYQLDHLLSKTYDIDNHKFIQSKETTFDRLLPTGGLHPYAGTAATAEKARTIAISAGLDPVTQADIIQGLADAAVMSMPQIAVDYAVRLPFDHINGRTISFILQHGGLDGTATVKEGQYLVFAKQELFGLTADESKIIKDPYDINNYDAVVFDEGITPTQYDATNDGWNIEYGLYGATGWSETPYAPTSIVPGYTEKLQSDATNQRAGIWKIHVNADNVVTLEFVIETGVNEYVQVKTGATYGDTKLYYDPVIHANQTVPAYSMLSDKLNNSQKTTRFDMGATRFFNDVDMYALPETEDIYLKFPKFNIYAAQTDK